MVYMYSCTIRLFLLLFAKRIREMADKYLKVQSFFCYVISESWKTVENVLFIKGVMVIRVKYM